MEIKLEGRSSRKPLALVPTTSSSSSVNLLRNCSLVTSSSASSATSLVASSRLPSSSSSSVENEGTRIFRTRGVEDSGIVISSNRSTSLSPRQGHKAGRKGEADPDVRENVDSVPEATPGVVVLGVCAMAKKSQSRPMKEILGRLEKRFVDIKTTVFSQDIILHAPVDKWPVCDCLIAFHSEGFPLDKAAAYVTLRRPYLINSVDMQYLLQDRRKVYEILQRERINLPRYAVLHRGDDDCQADQLIESPTQVTINGLTFHKPFVEKPVSAEDHNVYLYYSPAEGGGSQRLFRKVGGWSSIHSSESSVRQKGSYIYEDYIPTNCRMDIKVYTVGPDYAHAEARKSPAVDGKVERDAEGREIRYPVVLTPEERLIARKVCLAFQQTVCGFDLLRAQDGKSYVCDVNGFSFVKNSAKYYDDCANILGNMIMREILRERSKGKGG